MALALSGSLALSTPAARADYLPRILYANHYLDGTVTASSAQTGHPADSAYDGFTDTAWIGDAAAASWSLSVAKAGARADYCAVMAWDLTGITVTVQASDDGGSTWADVASPAMTTDRVLVFLFTEAQHDDWRIHFSGSAPPQVANVSLGLATVMDAGIPIGFEPPRQARDNEITNNKTDQGHLAGRSVVRRGIKTGLTLKNLGEAWVRSAWEPFIDHAETRPWYLVWSPVRWPAECAFVWTDGAIRPPRYSSARYMDVQLDIKGFAR